MSDSTVPSSRPARWGLRIAALLVLGGVVAVPLAVAGGAAAGCHGGWGGPETAEEARTMVGKASARMLDRLDATDEQQARVDATLDTAVPTLFALHEEAQDLRDEVHDALLGETVDADRVEAARVDAMSLADRGSRVLAAAAVEIFSTLTPEQRAEVTEQIDRHGPERGK